MTDAPLDRKMDRLRELPTAMGHVLVAYSGGVDSTFLAAAARVTLSVSATRTKV